MDNNLNIFIAYDEIDNSGPSYSGIKWVDQLCAYISKAAEELNGQSLQIRKIDDWNPETVNENDVYLLLTVLSQESQDSSALISQLVKFDNLVAGNEKLSERCKVIKICKSPVMYQLQPESIRNLEPYEFFYKETYTDNNYLDGETQDKFTSNYWIQISGLVYQVFEFFYEVKHGANKADQQSVYLANCSHDLVTYRQIIKRELVRDGYKVLPDKTYPDDMVLAKQMIAKDIETCNLSIHLIGAYSEENLYQSFTLSNLQFQIASAHQNPAFRKLIWTSPEVEFFDEEQNSFFEFVKRDSENKENSDIIQSTLEELKATVKTILKRKELTKKTEPAHHEQPGSTKPNLYLVYDFIDKESGEKLAGCLNTLGYHVNTPAFDKDYIQAREIQKEHLKNFDIALVFFENSSDKWLMMKLMELMKSPGLGRIKPVYVKLLISDEANFVPQKIGNFMVDHIAIDSTSLDNTAMVSGILENSGVLKVFKS